MTDHEGFSSHLTTKILRQMKSLRDLIMKQLRLSTWHKSLQTDPMHITNRLKQPHYPYEALALTAMRVGRGKVRPVEELPALLSAAGFVHRQRMRLAHWRRTKSCTWHLLDTRVGSDTAGLH